MRCDGSRGLSIFYELKEYECWIFFFFFFSKLLQFKKRMTQSNVCKGSGTLVTVVIGFKDCFLFMFLF